MKFGKNDRKIDVMQPCLARQAATGRSGVAAIGVAQEFQRVWSVCQRDTAPGWLRSKPSRKLTGG